MNVETHKHLLHSGFLRNVQARSEHEALRVEGSSYTYQELFDIAAGLSATLMQNDPGQGKLTAVFGRRSLTTYAGLLATLMRGHGYVSLNPKHPAERTRKVLEKSEATAVLVDQVSEKFLEDVVNGQQRLWILPHREDVSDLVQRWPEQKWIGASELLASDAWTPIQTDPCTCAYVIFTSGSTGEPKGVMVEHRNVAQFIEGMCEILPFSADDRCSQMPEVSFDGSIGDLWVTWEVGATVCVPTDMDMLRPHEFIQREELTVWVFVPSITALMHRLKLLKPGVFPNLRISIFGGEVLPQIVAEAWAEAAPNSIIENHYGPTEMTVTSLRYRWSEDAPSDCRDGVVPIGSPMPGMTARVLDEERNEVSAGEVGELWLAGPQLTRGYWGDPERTKASFMVPNGGDQQHYRTGDRVVRPKCNRPMQFLGRVDDQIQIRAHRVELAEIEGVLRDLTGASIVVALGWPETAPGSADGIAAFVQAKELDVQETIAKVSEILPDYMCPRKIVVMENLPMNANDKVDRRRLMEILKS